MIDWVYEGEIITDISQLKNAIGFIYEVELSNGKRYIGRKVCIFKRKKMLTKKELALITDKRLKKYKYVEKESDWKTYYGSNKQLQEDVKNGVKVVKRTIIQLCYSNKQMTYYEAKELFCNNVLLSDEYYNDNILGKMYRSDLVDDTH